MASGELLGLADHAGAALRRRRQNEPRPEHPHDLAALDREGLRHDGDEGIALDCTDHREGDAGVAGSRLDDRLTRLQHTAALGILDDPYREPVLDRGGRIEELALHIHRDMLWRETID